MATRSAAQKKPAEETKAQESPAQEAAQEATLDRAGLAVWDEVFNTDPKYTKEFKRTGGFSGTSINSTYQIFRATLLWGPMGGAWGAEIVNESYREGKPLLNANGDKTGNEIIHVLRMHVWYPNPLAKAGVGLCTVDGVGVIEQFGQTTFVGSTRNGPVTDEEAPKKSYTDALMKCLSWLGFSADVYMGLYDDNKYVNDRRRAEDGENPDASRNTSQRNERAQATQGEPRRTEPKDRGDQRQDGICTPGQIERLVKKLKDSGRDPADRKILAWLKADRIENVTHEAYERAIASLSRETGDDNQKAQA